MIRRLAVVALAVALAAGAAACGEDDGAKGVDSTVNGPSTTVDPNRLPPLTALELEPLYGDALAAIGMQLTDRGGLIDTTGGGYVASPAGQHLALYVEPIDDRTMQQYVDGILDVSLVFSDIYDRWPGLETYDVCQEPTDPDGTQDPEPPPVTQVELSRAQSDAIDWDTATVESLIEGAHADPPALVLRVSSDMVDDPAYQAVAPDKAENNSPYG